MQGECIPHRVPDPTEAGAFCLLLLKKESGYSMVKAIENVVSFPVTFSQGRM
ncbi:hypothetical protein SAMN04488571_101108 [Methanoculleus thermophilus]|jgi:hypothetical protein|uniref:Uncharacterized protein n=1 Tax=Methanoculleus thermophilus TaxID=2200 RepID=A0A1G8WUE0_9EURY|nr:hypothetical protein SAMN04488571_101108 [Methanoculleus thermophilus]